MYKRLLDCYYNGSRLRFLEMLGKYKGLTRKQCVCGIEICQNGYYPVPCCAPVSTKDKFGIIKYLNQHQHRISKTILSAFAAKVATLKPASSFSNFDEYFDYVVKNSGLKDGNCLLVYDYCLRTGYPDLVPEKYVYLFRGAREGAITVLGKVGSFRIETTVLQKALGTTMQSMEIEDFLCVCKVPLQYLASSCKVAVCPSGGCGSSASATK